MPDATPSPDTDPGPAVGPGPAAGTGPAVGQGPGPGAMPAAEIDIDAALVRRLLDDQHPDLAGLALVELANGWDNVMFRLGDELTVRLPRRQVAAVLVENEQRWLPVLAPHLPVPIPAPVRIGRPSGSYPWSWSVLPFLDGVAAATDRGFDGPSVARDLGRFLAALHQPAPADAPANRVRGIPLAGRDADVRSRLERLSDRLDTETLARRWERCRDAPAWSGPPLWLHGDLHAHNLLTARGRLSAVIDFGDITSGDPATDLGVAWSLLDQGDHAGFRAAADSATRPIDDAMWCRAEGWALTVGLAVVANSSDNPAMEAMGRRMIGAD